MEGSLINEEEGYQLITKNKPNTPRLTVIYVSFITLALHAFQQTLKYLYTYLFDYMGYQQMGTYALVLFLVGDAVSILFVYQIVQKLGCQSAMVLGSMLIFLQVASFYLVIWMPEKQQGTTTYKLIYAFTLIGGFCGGIGVVLRWQGIIFYVLDCQQFIYKSTFSITCLKVFNNISLLIGFPLTGAILSSFDTETLISSNLVVITGCMMMELTLPRVGRENRKGLVPYGYYSNFFEQILSSKFSKFIPILILKGVIQAFSLGVMVQFTQGFAGSQTLNILTLFGVGKALKIITRDYKIFFNRNLILLGFLLILGQVAVLIALINIKMYVIVESIDKKLYFIILILGILCSMIDSYIQFQADNFQDGHEREFNDVCDSMGQLSTALFVFFLMWAVYNEDFLIYTNIMLSFGLIAVLYNCTVVYKKQPQRYEYLST